MFHRKTTASPIDLHIREYQYVSHASTSYSGASLSVKITILKKVLVGVPGYSNQLHAFYIFPHLATIALRRNRANRERVGENVAWVVLLPCTHQSTYSVAVISPVRANRYVLVDIARIARISGI
jgi:hypothetical protein